MIDSRPFVMHVCASDFKLFAPITYRTVADDEFELRHLLRVAKIEFYTSHLHGRAAGDTYCILRVVMANIRTQLNENDRNSACSERIMYWLRQVATRERSECVNTSEVDFEIALV